MTGKGKGSEKDLQQEWKPGGPLEEQQGECFKPRLKTGGLKEAFTLTSVQEVTEIRTENNAS